MMFIVRFAEYGDCWLAPWGGDPGRTLEVASAKRYKSKKIAKAAATRNHRRFSWRKIGVVEPAPESTIRAGAST